MQKNALKLDKISIKWRVFLYLVCFCVLLLFLLWLLQVVFLESFYKRFRLHEIENEALHMAGYVQQEDWNSLQLAAAARNDIFVEVWQPGTFKSLLLGGSLPDVIHQSLSNAEKVLLYAQTMHNGGSLTQHYYNNDFFGRRRSPQEGIRHSMVLETTKKDYYFLMVSADISPVNAAVETLRVQLLYISGAMLVLSVGIALLISMWMSRPIVQLNAAAAQLGRGKYDVRFTAHGYREIAELSATLNNAAEELARTDTLRRELIANVSHDLRTPLTLICGYGEMMRDIPGEITAKNMQVIVDEAKRLASLVNNLMDLSRMEAGMGSMLLAPFDLTRCIEGIIDRLSHFCEKDGYTIRFEHHGHVTVNAAEERIAQVLYNFLTNAVTYTGTNKLVTVRQTTAEGRVLVEVEDTGTGIAPEELANVWERYYKSSSVSTHRRAAEGTGLGLSIVKAILEHHPGVEYGVHSQLGMGSTFWFSLPIQ